MGRSKQKGLAGRKLWYSLRAFDIDRRLDLPALIRGRRLRGRPDGFSKTVEKQRGPLKNPAESGHGTDPAGENSGRRFAVETIQTAVLIFGDLSVRILW